MTTANRVTDLYAMWRIRLLEERIRDLWQAGEIVGSVHLCIGQEAGPVAACATLRPTDPLFATYRGHGWAMAHGVSPRGILAELLGRSTGVNGGRGGSTHFSSADDSFYGENSIVGAGAAVALGAALSSRFDGSERVALTVFGDGAINQGAVSESMNFAAALNLPVLFYCENNRYSELTPIDAMVRNPDLSARATALGMPGVRIDGNDIGAIRSAVSMAAQSARAGHGPTFLEASTQRLVGHYIGDAEQYRTAGEREADLDREPIGRLTRELTASGVSQQALEDAHRRAASEIDAAATAALDDPRADPAKVGEHLYA